MDPGLKSREDLGFKSDADIGFKSREDPGLKTGADSGFKSGADPGFSDRGRWLAPQPPSLNKMHVHLSQFSRSGSE